MAKSMGNLRTEVSDRLRGNTTIRTFEDGSIRFLPPFTKEEAAYFPTDDPAFDPTHDRCGSCVHYIPGMGCHFVQGEIDPEAYCEEFYADYAAFAHEHPGHAEINAELAAPNWAWSEETITDFVTDVRERLEQRRRDRSGGE